MQHGVSIRVPLRIEHLQRLVRAHHQEQLRLREPFGRGLHLLRKQAMRGNAHGVAWPGGAETLEDLDPCLHGEERWRCGLVLGQRPKREHEGHEIGPAKGPSGQRLVGHGQWIERPGEHGEGAHGAWGRQDLERGAGGRPDAVDERFRDHVPLGWPFDGGPVGHGRGPGR